jgi:hypothetical protein
MAIDSTAPRTRRAVIGAALGGAAAVAATSLAGPLSARAATGGNVVLGQGSDAGENEADAATIVKNLTDAQVSLSGQHAGAGTGVHGSSVTGAGIWGASLDSTPTTDWSVPSHKTGVWGTAGDTTGASPGTDETGVYGYAAVSEASSGVWGESTIGYGVYGNGSTGIYGDGDWGVYGTGSTGVVGDAGSGGVGVYGFAGDIDIPVPTYGVGVYARAGTTAQTALQVVGKVRFSRSARVSFTSSQTSKRVNMTGVTSSSYVVATMQTNVSGLYVRAVVCASGYFTIYLSKSGGKTVWVGYMVIN